MSHEILKKKSNTTTPASYSGSRNICIPPHFLCVLLPQKFVQIISVLHPLVSPAFPLISCSIHHRFPFTARVRVFLSKKGNSYSISAFHLTSISSCSIKYTILDSIYPYPAITFYKVHQYSLQAKFFFFFKLIFKYLNVLNNAEYFYGDI